MLNSMRWPKIIGVQFGYFHRFTNTGSLCYAVMCAKLTDNKDEGTSGHQVRTITLKQSHTLQINKRWGLTLI